MLPSGWDDTDALLTLLGDVVSCRLDKGSEEVFEAPRRGGAGASSGGGEALIPSAMEVGGDGYRRRESGGTTRMAMPCG